MGSPPDYPTYNGRIEKWVNDHGFWRSNIRGLHELLTGAHIRTPRAGNNEMQPLTKRYVFLYYSVYTIGLFYL